MEAQAAIRQRAMELQESIGDLAKFAAQQKKKDAALKDAAARKAALAATGDGAASAMVRHVSCRNMHHCLGSATPKVASGTQTTGWALRMLQGHK